MTIVLKIPAARVRDVLVRTLKTFIAAVAVTTPLSRWLTLAGQPLPAVWAFALPPFIAGATAVGNYWLHVGAASKDARAQKAAADLQALAVAIDAGVKAQLPGAVQKVIDGLAASGSLGGSQVPSPAPVFSPPQSVTSAP